MTRDDLPVWRSMLFVPVTAERFVNGAARRGADAIILDLEDAVAASEKARARTPGARGGGDRRRAAAPMSSCASTGRCA